MGNVAVPIDDQIAEVKRELRMRAHAYPRFVAAGKLTLLESARQTARLEAALETLERVKVETDPQGGLLP